MKRTSGKIAVIGFFLLAIVSGFGGLPIEVCSMRAIGGAIVLYLISEFVAVAVSYILAATPSVDVGRERKGKSL